MLKTRFRKAILFALLLLPFLLNTGCINNAISDGVIRGKLYVFEGDQPALNPVKVRVEALPNNGSESVKRLNFRYTIIEPSAHGEYVINNVPPGEYTLQFDIQGKVNAYAYLLGLTDLGPTQPTDAGTVDTASVPVAYVESGRTYDMPDYYVVKSPQTGSGTFKGTFVYSPNQVPVEKLSIIMTNANAAGTTKYGTTNADGTIIFPKLEAGTWTISFADSGTPIYAMTDPNQTSVTISDNHVYEKTYQLKFDNTVNKLPTVRGLVNVPKNFQMWLNPATDIVAYLSIQDSTGNFVNFAIEQNCYFEINVQPWISKYQLVITAREPLSSNKLIYPIPSLNPGQVHDIPDNALNLEIAHKIVNVQVYPPVGTTPRGEIVVDVNVVNGKENNFIAKPAGQFWAVSVDVPYSLATFGCSTVFKIGDDPDNTTDVNAIDVQVAVSESSADVVKVFYSALPGP